MKWLWGGVIFGFVWLLAKAGIAKPVETIPQTYPELPPTPHTPELKKEIEKEIKKIEERAAIPPGEPVSDTTTPVPENPSSPFPNVSDVAWREFVKRMKQGAVSTFSQSGYLGAFLMGAPKLEDLGAMRNVQKVTRNGREIRMGEFIAPLTMEGFLRDGSLQYELFVKDMRRLRSAINARHAEALGNEHAGQLATLSGLLGVAKHGGLGTLAKWLGPDTSKFPATTGAYKLVNGLF